MIGEKLLIRTIVGESFVGALLTDHFLVHGPHMVHMDAVLSIASVYNNIYCDVFLIVVSILNMVPVKKYQ